MGRLSLPFGETAPSVKMSRESDPDEDTDGVTYLDGYWDGYDKAAQQFVDDYYRNGDYTSDDQSEDEESSDSDSDESGSDEESSDSDSDKDEDHKYKYKYKYKYKSSDKSNDEPKDEPKDDKQTDQKYSVNTVRLWGNDTDDSSDEEPTWLYGH